MPRSAHRTLLWFRQDLRLADNPALRAAIARGQVIPVYLWTPQEEGDWPPGAASRWWLHHSLNALAADIAKRGGALRVLSSDRQGALTLLQHLIREHDADGVCWNRRYEPAALARDSEVKTVLRAAGHWVHSFNAALLEEPWEVKNQAGKPFQVFTPYWRRALQALDPPEPRPAPRRWPADDRPAPTLAHTQQQIDALALRPRIAWDAGMAATWTPGEAGARERLDAFLAGPVKTYETDRDRPAVEGTSRLSPHLHFGEISPRQVWHATLASRRGGTARDGRFLTEIGWREFAHHLLFHFPQTPNEPLRPEFRHFPWQDDPDALKAWQQGRTGIALVDAGMRQLWHEGWMHNRVRMVVGSLLVKNLQINWLEGARWFWDTLVDADLANNTLGWQWVGGCGADAAPYFRVFNPQSQRERFDPEDIYVKRWVPEIDDPARYPPSLINLGTSRITALAAYAQMKETSQENST